jgi:hypothetical protein
MVAAAGIDEHYVGDDGERLDRPLQESALAQRQQARRIRCAGLAGHDRIGKDTTPARDGGRCPRLVSLGTGARPTAREAHDARADRGRHRRRPPQWRIHSRERTLGVDELCRRPRPHDGSLTRPFCQVSRSLRASDLRGRR